MNNSIRRRARIVEYKGDENGDDDVDIVVSSLILITLTTTIPLLSSIIITTTEHVQYLDVDVELLFEDYLLQIEKVLYSLRSVQNLVRNTEKVVLFELDLLRNRIMMNEMLLKILGLVSTRVIVIVVP